jgi:YVTN family beta-propeller protein
MKLWLAILSSPLKIKASVPCIILAITLHTAFASESRDDFAATTETVGRHEGGFETPANQRIAPAGTLVELPGIRPNALALSPNGKFLVTAGMTRELLILDPASGTILQTVSFPNAATNLSSERGSALILNANLRDKLSFTGITFSPDGSRIYLSNVNGDIKVFEVGQDNKVAALRSIPLPPVNLPDRKMEIPAGLTTSPDGRSLFVAFNVANQLAEIDIATGRILRRWNVGVAPLSVVRCRSKTYVSNWGGRRPDSDSVVGPIGRNGTVRVDERSIASEGSVSVINLAENPSANKNQTLEILTGRHASALALSPNGKFVVCANAGDDTLSVIDTRSDRVVETICARQSPADLFGAQPDALAFDKRGRELFVCNGSQNAVAVFQFQQQTRWLGLFPFFRYIPGKTQMLGLIPVGWFPGSIAFDSHRARLHVANLIHIPPKKEQAPKHRGTGPGFNTKQYYGSLSLVDVPAKDELEKDTRIALANLRYPLIAQSKLPPRAHRAPQPVPERVGEPSPLKHVIYIIKENRTYDQVLGDISDGNGNRDLCVFGERVTPNLHKCVREFALLDNTYCSGIISAEGHQWTDSGIANDYIQRSYNGWPKSYPGAGGEAHGYDALAYSSAGFIWNDALEHGKSVLVLGEFTTPHHYWKATGKSQAGWLESYRDFISDSNAFGYYAEAGLPAIRHCVETNYLGFDLTVPDAIRAAQFIKDLKQFEQAGQMPDLMIVWLPDDHTSGSKFGAPTPEAQVADNDLAFGKILEAVSHSKFWADTCIFAIEDDPQDGWDHVSGYRATAYVASPYTKRNAVIHTQYNQTSVLRTIELILGIPPMNQLDATATPMFDCFTNQPDLAPFDAVANNIPLDQMNPDPKKISDSRLRKDALISAKLPLDKEDQCPEDLFNRILWRAVKGQAAPYPSWAVKAADDDD